MSDLLLGIARGIGFIWGVLAVAVTFLLVSGLVGVAVGVAVLAYRWTVGS